MGLKIQTNGNILLNYVNTYMNSKSGVYFANSTPSNVVMNHGNNNGNTENGIYISTAGSITVNGVTSTSNLKDGAAFINIDALSPKNVVVNESVFSGNTDFGLEVYSNGSISFKNITVDDNLYHGAWLQAASSFFPPQKVTITGSKFEGNSRVGLYLRATGAITLSNLSAGHNGSGGAEIVSWGGTATPVKISNALFDGNSGIYDYGFFIESHGPVTLNQYRRQL